MLPKQLKISILHDIDQIHNTLCYMKQAYLLLSGDQIWHNLLKEI